MCHLIKWQGSPPFMQTFSFDFTTIFFSFFKPPLFAFGYDYYASARMVASHLNHQIILLLKRPSNPPLILPFKFQTK